MGLGPLKAHIAVSYWAAAYRHAPLWLPDSPDDSSGKPALSSSQNELFPPLAHGLILTWSDRAAALLPAPRFWEHEDRSAQSTQYAALTQPTCAPLCSKVTNGPTLTIKQILSVPASQ